ncbi:NADH-quinone oxidoreductase subunit N [Aureimonas endophytica]|uniref:NADH-quinone oxidoreductase subunit N n=1 Tax=Aureimonas endophytica TaxID=2027858 RepID=A0A916ZD99_9HYPH|nr:NADH-quinone oxidoreductase subunit NuoN [Aureimonas endophytica]GGD88181.1 NADH-quinone oxidoreductase subunit N [Aureimonas endophytica]
MTQAFSASLAIAAPEVILGIGAMVLLMIGVFTGERSARFMTTLSVVLLFVTALWLIFATPDGRAFDGSFELDAFARFMKILVLIGSAATMILTVGYAESDHFNRFEFPVIICLSTVGMMVMVSAGDLIALYMGLELQSLAAYVIAAFHRDSVKSTEAGLKYFVLGALSSGILLYGASMVYGFTGQIEFEAIARALSGETRSVGLLVGLVFVIAGLSFKLSLVPFHMWTPDVYEGSPTPVTAFFASAPKVAAMGLLTRFTMEGFGPFVADWRQVLVFVSILSMAFGAFAAIGQTNIKRLMAYSSIGHMGYALVGLSAGDAAGVRGVAVYMAIYMTMTLGVFAVVMAMRRREGQTQDVYELKGLSQTNPSMALALTVLMLSLAGLPPLGGFIAKYYVFMAAVGAGLWPLAIIGVVTSVVSLFYYLRIVKVMWFDEPAAGFVPASLELRGVLAVSTLFIFPVYIFFAGPILAAAQTAASSFF